MKTLNARCHKCGQVMLIDIGTTRRPADYAPGKMKGGDSALRHARMVPTLHNDCAELILKFWGSTAFAELSKRIRRDFAPSSGGGRL